MVANNQPSASQEAPAGLAGQQITDILESISDGFFALDNAWRFSYLNAEAERLLGRQRRELLGKKVWEEFPEAVGSTFYKEYQRAKTDNITVRFEEYYPPLDGWFEVRAYPYADGLSVYFQNVTLRKRTEIALQESEQRYRTTFDAAPVAVAHTSLDGHWTYFNDRLLEITGYSREEMQERRFQDVTHRDDLPQDLVNMRKLLAGEAKSIEREKRYIRKDGSIVWVLLTVSLVRDTEGVPQHFIAVIADSTRQKEAESALQRQTIVLQAVMDNIAEGVTVADANRKLLLINRTAQSMLGLKSVEEKPGQTVWDYQLFQPDGSALIPDDRRPMIRALRGETVDNLVTYVQHAGRPEGLLASANGRPLKDAKGDAIGAVVVFRDVTSQLRAETLLREQADLLNLSHDAVLVRDLNDRISFWNRHAEVLYGFTREEALGRVSHQLLHTEFSEPLAGIQSELKAQGFWEGELTHTTRQGNKVTVLSRWSQERGTDGKVERLLETNTDISWRKQMEQALKTREERFRLIIDNALDAFITIDEDDKVIQWSRKAEEMFGWSRQEAAGRVLNELIIPPQYREAHARGMAHYKRTESGPVLGRRIEITALRRDGSEFPVELAITPIKVEGSGTMFSAAIRDITQRKLAEQEVLESRAELEAALEANKNILDYSLGIICTIDEEGRFAQISSASERIWGYRPEEWVGKPFIDIVAPEDREKTLEAVTHIKDGQPAFNFENRNIRKDGSLVTMLWNSNWSPKNQVVVAVGSDITELKQAARQLEESEERFRLTFEQIGMGMAHFTVDGKLLRVNDILVDITGYTEDELIQRDLRTLSHPDDVEVSTPHLARLATGESNSVSFEKRYLRKDGRPFWAHVTASAVRAPDGAIRYFIAALQDISERRRIEEALRQAEADFRLLMESVTDYGIIVIDTEGRIEMWNPGAETLFGYPEEEVIGANTDFTFTPEDRGRGEPERELRIAREEGRALDERWHLRKDGSRFFATGMAFPLRRGDGTLRGFVKVTRDNTRQRETEERMTYLANHDVLTGLPNRAYLSDRLHEEMARARRDHKHLGFLMLDLDRFKTVNDTLGHQVGDLLLKEVAARLLSSVRETDVVARLGGDEFVVLAAGLEKPEDVEVLAQKIVDELGLPYSLEGTEIHSGTSIGVALYPPDAGESVDLMVHADLALYRAKERGRHNYQVFTDALHLEARGKASLEEDLRQAIGRKEFQLAYQPIIDIEKMETQGVEVLLRWNHPRLQTLSPRDFMTLAEETGQLVVIGEWVLRQACRQGYAWQKRGIPAFRMAVNISARQLKEPGFAAMVKQVLQESGFAPACLDLELSESLMALEGSDTILKELQTIGVHIVIDDFGTGQVPLSYIRHAPVDAIKIDKSLIAHVAHSRKDNAVVEAAVVLAQSMGIQVVAEGVESIEQLAFLRNHGCNSAQGFLFTEPVSAGEMEGLLRQGCWSRMNPV